MVSQQFAKLYPPKKRVVGSTPTSSADDWRVARMAIRLVLKTSALFGLAGSSPAPSASLQFWSFEKVLPRPRFARARQKLRFYTDF
jgi:hypothetical protein